MCTCFLRSFVLSVDFGSGTTLAFLSSDGEMFFSVHKLKTYVSESIMYGKDNFSRWLRLQERDRELCPFLVFTAIFLVTYICCGIPAHDHRYRAD